MSKGALPVGILDRMLAEDCIIHPRQVLCILLSKDFGPFTPPLNGLHRFLEGPQLISFLKEAR